MANPAREERAQTKFARTGDADSPVRVCEKRQLDASAASQVLETWLSRDIISGTGGVGYATRRVACSSERSNGSVVSHQGPQGPPTGKACRSRSVESGTAIEDKKHETSLDWRRHGRGPRDRRSGLGAERSRREQPDQWFLRTFRAETGRRAPIIFRPAGRRAGEADGGQEAHASSHGHAPSSGKLRRSDDRAAQCARAAAHPGRRHGASASVADPRRQQPDQRYGWSVRPGRFGTAAAVSSVNPTPSCRYEREGASAPLLFLITKDGFPISSIES